MSAGTSSSNHFVPWLSRHATALTSFAPDAPLDDLEPLNDLIGHARVVAIGESSHFIREFWLMRQRILRFLVERCGFTVLACEFGFSEGIPIDSWVRGSGVEADLEPLVAGMLPLGFTEPLQWLRRNNAHASNPAAERFSCSIGEIGRRTQCGKAKIQKALQEQGWSKDEGLGVFAARRFATTKTNTRPLSRDDIETYDLPDSSSSESSIE